MAKAARRLGLGEFLRLGKGEERTQGRGKSSLLANALEAVIAAIYLDGGFNPARSFVLMVLREDLVVLEQGDQFSSRQDYKSQLQEWCQRTFSEIPEYRLIKELGPDHEKVFDVEVRIKGTTQGRGTGHNKKLAEQEAAKEALRHFSLGNSEEISSSMV